MAATDVLGSYLGPATYQKLLQLCTPVLSPVNGVVQAKDSVGITGVNEHEVPSKIPGTQ